MLIKHVFLILLFLSFSVAGAEIYSWVDEQGKKHFGDRVPIKYKEQASQKEIVIPRQTVEQAMEDRKREQALWNRAYGMPTAKEIEREKQKLYDKLAADAKKLPKFKPKAQTYEESVKCFSRCQTRFERADGRIVVSNSRCGHCQNVSRSKRKEK